MTERIDCRVSGCGWDTRGSNAGAGACVDMGDDGCLLSLCCSRRADDDRCEHEMDAPLLAYAAESARLAAPDRPHTEEYRRGDQLALLYVRADGTVSCSSELMRRLLAEAGWTWAK